MKTFTPNLLKFTVVTIITTVLFRLILSNILENRLFGWAIVAGVLYGLIMFFLGWYFGKKDYEYLPVFDLGLRFNVAAFIVFNGISELWFLFGWNSMQYESIHSLRITEIIWGMVLLVHFVVYLIYRRNHSINSLDKSELFD